VGGELTAKVILVAVNAVKMARHFLAERSAGGSAQNEMLAWAACFFL
jgi:hypothetical protein